MAPPTKHHVTPELLEELKSKLSVGADEKLKAANEEGLTHRTLRRWLVARKFQMDKAAKDLDAHAAWRAEHTPNGPVPDEDVLGELEQDKAFLPGVDKAGHPTMVARVRNHKIAKDHKDFYRFMIWVLDTGDLCGRVEEKKTGREWDGKVVGILDLSNITLSNCDSSGLLTIFDLLQNHYVERLHKMYLYCAPIIFSGVWAVVSPFVDPVTRAKVQFVTAKDAAEIFAREYEPGVLPADLGGSGPDRPAREARQQLLEQWKSLSLLPDPVPRAAPGNGEEVEVPGEAGDEEAAAPQEEAEADAPGAETRAEAIAVRPPTMVAA